VISPVLFHSWTVSILTHSFWDLLLGRVSLQKARFLFLLFDSHLVSDTSCATNTFFPPGPWTSFEHCARTGLQAAAARLSSLFSPLLCFASVNPRGPPAYSSRSQWWFSSLELDPPWDLRKGLSFFSADFSSLCFFLFRGKEVFSWFESFPWNTPFLSPTSFPQTLFASLPFCVGVFFLTLFFFRFLGFKAFFSRLYPPSSGGPLEAFCFPSTHAPKVLPFLRFPLLFPYSTLFFNFQMYSHRDLGFPS